MADTIRQAVEMSLSDRRDRMRRRRAYLALHDIKAWTDEYLRDGGLLPPDSGLSIV